jgi:hypothetical protein
VKLIPFLIFSAVLISACSCGCSSGSISDNSVRGSIVVVSNPPFSNIAIKTDEGKFYILDCSKELENQLWKEQGNFFYIKFKEMREENGETIIVVEKVLPLKKDTN